jgi:TRAP-type C4-dicarboxylate transport system substrate-binding protein
MSDAWLQSLPEDLQNMVIDGVVQMADIQSNWNKQYEERSLREFVETGGTVYVPSAEERETFMAATDDMKQWFLDNVDNAQEWLDAWEEAIAEAEAEIDADRARIAGRKS